MENIAIDATAVESQLEPEKIEKTAVSSVSDQRALTTEEIESQLTNDLQWGIKVNSKGRNVFWHGYKVHLAVTTASQYILSAILIRFSLRYFKICSTGHLLCQCSLQHEGMCQKVIKIKQDTNPRQHKHPARGTNVWDKLYAQRSSVERVNGNLKKNMKLNDTTHFKVELAEVELLLIQLGYNAQRYVAQRLTQQKVGKEVVA